MDSWLFERLRDDERPVDADAFVEFAIDVYRGVLSP
jgi:hypothetical protein